MTEQELKCLCDCHETKGIITCSRCEDLHYLISTGWKPNDFKKNG